MQHTFSKTYRNPLSFMTSSISLNVSGWLYKHNNIQEISDLISGTARYICSDCSHSSINSFSQTTYITDIKSSSAEYETRDQGISSIQPPLQSGNLAFRKCSTFKTETRYGPVLLEKSCSFFFVFNVLDLLQHKTSNTLRQIFHLMVTDK